METDKKERTVRQRVQSYDIMVRESFLVLEDDGQITAESPWRMKPGSWYLSTQYPDHQGQEARVAFAKLRLVRRTDVDEDREVDFDLEAVELDKYRVGTSTHAAWQELGGQLRGQFIVREYRLEQVWQKKDQTSRVMLDQLVCPARAQTDDLRRLLEQELKFYEDRTDDEALAQRERLTDALWRLNQGVLRLAVIDYVGQEKLVIQRRDIRLGRAQELAQVRAGTDAVLTASRTPGTDSLLAEAADLNAILTESALSQE
jgi:hypothetical protein